MRENEEFNNAQPVSSLPPELLVSILRHLGYTDQLSLNASCHFFNSKIPEDIINKAASAIKAHEKQIQEACSSLNVEKLTELLSQKSLTRGVVLRNNPELLTPLISTIGETKERLQYDVPTPKEFLNRVALMEAGEMISNQIGYLMLRSREITDATTRSSNMLACLQALINVGIKPSEKSVILAARFKQMQSLNMLISCGGKVSHELIIEAEKEACIEVLDYLRDKNFYDPCGDFFPGFPRICSAAFGMNSKLIEFLLENGADRNAVVSCDFESYFKELTALDGGDVPEEHVVKIKALFETRISGKIPAELCFVVRDTVEPENCSDFEAIKAGAQIAYELLSQKPSNTLGN